ncbi:MAG: hypothetical protein H7210_09350, partial [Pyrinomonadaceae bacterium]|nr:hypothetical protein [Phycisphaerales bacterium]
TLTPQRREVNSIQLVGNSSRVPLVQELMLQEFADVHEIKNNMMFESESAKSSVALGACLAAHLNDFGVDTRLRLKFKPLPEQLGWEIGEWVPPLMPFKAHFLFSAKPSERPTVDLDDRGQLEVVLFKFRAVSGEVPVVMGRFVLSRPPQVVTDIEPAPSEKLRLTLTGPDMLTLQRGNQMWTLIRSSQSIDPADDPFCGEH